jgi:hypothetical protein
MAKTDVSIRHIYTAQYDATNGKLVEKNRFGWKDPFVIALEVDLLPVDNGTQQPNVYDFLVQIVNPRADLTVPPGPLVDDTTKQPRYTLDFPIEEIHLGEERPGVSLEATKKNRGLLTLTFDHFSDALGNPIKGAKHWNVFSLQASMRGNRWWFATTPPSAYAFHFIGDPYVGYPLPDPKQTTPGKKVRPGLGIAPDPIKPVPTIDRGDGKG